VEYCRFDPVKHGLVGAVRDWPLSSFHRDVRRGLVGEEWAGEVVEGRDGEGQ
jgi:putative transposase